MIKMGAVRQEFASRRPFQLEPEKRAKIVETNSNARNIWCVLNELANHANWFVVTRFSGLIGQISTRSDSIIVFLPKPVDPTQL